MGQHEIHVIFLNESALGFKLILADTLGKNFGGRYFEIFSLLFSENRF